MSNVTDINEWRLAKSDALQELIKDWEDIRDLGGDITVHMLVAEDRTAKEFLDLRAFLDEIGATYTVRSTPPEDGLYVK